MNYSKKDTKKDIAIRIAKKLKHAKDLDVLSLVYIEGRVDQMLINKGEKPNA